MERLRNRIRRKLQICKEKIVDCKSAHAGSIPASASTFESPADYGLRGFFMPAIWRITSAIFGIASATRAFFCALLDMLLGMILQGGGGP